MAAGKEAGVNIVMPPKFGSEVPAIRSVRDCRYPFENLYIDVDGTAYPCVCRVNQDTFVGNIKEQTVAEIWNSEKFRAFRTAFVSDNPPRQCRECTFSVLDPGKLESHMTGELAETVRKYRSKTRRTIK